MRNQKAVWMWLLKQTEPAQDNTAPATLQRHNDPSTIFKDYPVKLRLFFCLFIWPLYKVFPLTGNDKLFLQRGAPALWALQIAETREGWSAQRSIPYFREGKKKNSGVNQHLTTSTRVFWTLNIHVNSCHCLKLQICPIFSNIRPKAVRSWGTKAPGCYKTRPKIH